MSEEFVLFGQGAFSLPGPCPLKSSFVQGKGQADPEGASHITPAF
eukprot:COSAG06_NODE_5461_length_3466_cov_18.986816_1_plen_44_part_10